MARIFGDNAIDQAGSCFRDSYTALLVAKSAPAEEVRLGEDPPDFLLKVRGEIQLFETVEVQAPDRRRGEELKTDRSLPDEARLAPRHVGDDGWISADAALAQLQSAVLKKAQRSPPYAPATLLAVYFNVGFIDESQILTEGLEAAIRCAFPAFAEVRVLQTSGETHVFSRGQTNRIGLHGPLDRQRR